MAGLITWYDILGILPGASTEEVRSACKARGRQVSPQMISGAPRRGSVSVARRKGPPVQHADRAGLAPTPTSERVRHIVLRASETHKIFTRL